MNDFNSNNTSPQPKFNSTLLVLGIGIVVLGCLLVLKNIAHAYEIRVMRFWPLIIVALGAVKLVEGKLRRIDGWILTAIGALLLYHSVSGFSIGDLIFPLILMIVGVFIVLHAVKRSRKVPSELQKSVDFARGTAILGAYKYKPSSGQFDGGEVTAIFGGFDMDLRQMTMKHDTARIDVFAMFGGGEIRVPEGWEVSVQAQAIAGNVEDKTISLPAADFKRPKLLITGSVLLGGVEVK
jgi:predicted membrane protein